MNKRLEKTILKFIDRYAKESWFEGAFWGGSSLYKPVDQTTDIDIFIVANDCLPARIHGTTICDGMFIEYFVNPISRLESQMLEEIETIHDYWVIKIYAFSRLLLERSEKARQLQESAYKLYNCPFSRNNTQTVIANYSKVWDGYNDYMGLVKAHLPADHMYFETLKNILHAYCYQQQVPLIPWNKCQELLTNSNYRAAYHFKALPDDEFCELFLRCFTSPTIDRPHEIANLYHYVIKDSGFDPSCFEQIK